MQTKCLCELLGALVPSRGEKRWYTKPRANREDKGRPMQRPRPKHWKTTSLQAMAESRPPKRISGVPKAGPGYNPGVFFKAELDNPAHLTQLILRAGDVEVNPGPGVECPTCRNEINDKRESSVFCNLGGWVHLKCTTLKSVVSYQRLVKEGDFFCLRCRYCVPQPPTCPIEGHRGGRVKAEVKRNPRVESCLPQPPTCPIEGHRTDGGKAGRKRNPRVEPTTKVTAPTCPIEGQSEQSKRKEQKAARRRKRQQMRHEKWVAKANWKEPSEVTTVWTWNIQRARVSFPKRNRFSEILRVIGRSNADVVLFTELREEQEGVKWIKAKEIFGILIHGKKSGVFLRDALATKWSDESGWKWCGDRCTAVEVNGCNYVSIYQPLWNCPDLDFQTYREEVSTVLLKCKGTNTIIGGDFNACIGDTSGREQNRVAGSFGFGRTNDTGKDLINWCHEHSLSWANSFFRHRNRGTWCSPGKSDYTKLMSSW